MQRRVFTSMVRVNFAVALLFIVSVLTPNSAYSTPITRVVMSVDDYMPYVSSAAPKADYPGYMVEIAQHIFAKHNITLTLESVPYVRAIQLGQEGRIDGMFAVNYPDPVFQAPYIAHGIDRVCLFGNEKQDTLTRLSTRTIGMTNGYNIDDIPELKQVAEELARSTTVIWLSGDNPVVRFLDMLRDRRIDGFIERQYVVDWYSKTLPKRYAYPKLCSGDKPSYILFFTASPNSAALAEIIHSGLQDLRASGQLGAILTKYAIEDWQQTDIHH